MPLFPFLLENVIYTFVLSGKDYFVMPTEHVVESLIQKRKFNRILLALFSTYGTVIGMVTSYCADVNYLSMMRMAASLPVSIVSLPVRILLPFLVTAAALFAEKAYLLFLLSFSKSLSYSFILASTYIAFSSAGWLVCGLMLFTDAFVFLFLQYFWIEFLDGSRKGTIADLLSAFLLSLLIGTVDFALISPYLAALINS